MDALDLIKTDHDRVRDLFQRFNATPDQAQRRELANQVFGELTIHTRLEEEYFYPALRANADEEGRELIDESFRDHQRMGQMIEELKAMRPGGQEFAARLQELMVLTEDHMEEEEVEVFPEARERLGGTLERLGSDMENRRQQLRGQRAA